MAFHTKTSYVKPHTKTSYIRPMCGKDANNKVLKDFSYCQFDSQGKSKNDPAMDKENVFNSPKKSLKCIDAKEKGLEKLNSAYTNLFEELEKIQTWKTSIQIEYKQKSKKLEELNKIIESQRKVILDLQMQNENISMQMSDEVQKRVNLLEKFSSTIELSSVLKKRIQDLQFQFNSRSKTEDILNNNNQEKMKILEDLTDKFNKMKIESSEKINNLNLALSKEKQNVLQLKDLCEEQSLNSEKEHKSYCSVIEKYQAELKTISKEIIEEKQKTVALEQTKTSLIQKLTELEDANSVCLNKIKDLEQELKLIKDSKLEIENNYNAECDKVKDMYVKCKEFEEFISNQKSEFQAKCDVLESTINSFQGNIVELEKKLEKSEINNGKLSLLVQEMESEKCDFENKISMLEQEKLELKENFQVDLQNVVQIKDQFMKEKNELNDALENLKEEMQRTILNKKEIAEVCTENERQLLELTKAYENSELKVQELITVENKYHECLAKIKELEKNFNEKSESLALKELKIEEMQLLEDNYSKCLIKIKELENQIQMKSELLLSNELKLEELNNVEEMYSTLSKKFKELEIEIKNKSDLLDLKNKAIADLNASVNQNNLTLETLQYENLEMRENIQKEKDSVKICLECEIMKDKVKEYDRLINEHTMTEQELMNQRELTNTTVKMLNETEENFDKMRIKKEKEIIKYKEKIESLQHEISMLNVQLDNLKKLEVENENLRLNIGEISLQNAGDLQRLQVENAELRQELEALKPVKDYAKDKITLTVMEPVDENKKIGDGKKNSLQRNTIIDEKMEADSSCDEIMVLNSKEFKATSTPKRPIRLMNRKPISNLKKANIVPIVEKRKRNWESGSSGSECLEIVFDKDATKIMGFAPKGKSSEFKKSPSTPAGNRMNALSLNNKQTPNFTASSKHSSLLYKTVKTPENDIDFLKSKEDFKEPTIEDSPWMKRKALQNRTPTTPFQRKFFKTPLKEREIPFIKPQIGKPKF